MREKSEAMHMHEREVCGRDESVEVEVRREERDGMVKEKDRGNRREMQLSFVCAHKREAKEIISFRMRISSMHTKENKRDNVLAMERYIEEKKRREDGGRKKELEVEKKKS